jgi:hypothetical protein
MRDFIARDNEGEISWKFFYDFELIADRPTKPIRLKSIVHKS